MKTSKKHIYKLILIITLIICYSCEDSSECDETRCSDYSSQSAAQADFNENPECRSNLDSDNDGVACENLNN